MAKAETPLTWEGVLTDLAMRVELAELALDEGIDLDPRLLMPWTPPQGLGPLPERLRDRAVTVLAAQADLEKRLQTAMDQLSKEIGQTNQGRKLSPFGETVVPKYFDRAI